MTNLCGPRCAAFLFAGMAACAGEKVDLGFTNDGGIGDGGGSVAVDGAAADVLPATPDAAADAPTFPMGCTPPGAHWLVFDSDRDNYKRDIFAIQSDGTGLTRLTNDPGLEQEPAFAPDGIHLAYASDASGTSQIYVLNVQSRQVMQLTQRPDGADQPVWSPDGTLVAYHGGDGETGAVYTIHADGTGETEVAVDNQPGQGACECAYEHPAFTPDGAFLLVDRDNQIERRNLDGTNAVFVIPNGAYTAVMPSVSLDGATLVYVGANCGVTTTPLDTPAYCDREVASGGTRPSFGPGGVLAYDQGTPADVFVVTAECGAVNVTNNAADDRDARWAPPTFTGATSVPAPQ